MHDRTLLFLCAVLLMSAATSMARADANAIDQRSDHAKWKGTLYDGTPITTVDISRILEAHERWFKGEKDGTKANLSGAKLPGVELTKVSLTDAVLFEVDLSSANLRGTDLRRADLRGATLAHTSLSRASLINANLNKANLVEADLSEAALIEANLGEAYLGGADLRGADLRGANLDSAELFGAKLEGATWAKASMRYAHMNRADFRTADLSDTNLHEAQLREADLRDANLDHSKMNGANLLGAKMSGAILSEANVSDVAFDLEPGTLPNILSMASASGLADMRYERSPASLIELREAFRTAGLRAQASEVHFAIMHTRRLQAGRFEKILLLAVEIPCDYGMRPVRPLLILLSAILAFWIPYLFALKKRGTGGIWIIWPDDRTPKDEATEKDARLSPPWFRRIGVALYFSVVSAFNIGWEEINIGSWIARMQPKEFTLKATGWVRVVAGVQSLLGVYMVALSILSYFGHLFE